MRHVRLVTLAVAAVALAWHATPRVAARQAAPGAPSGLTWLSQGGTVNLLWTHSTGTFTHYNVEAAAAPGAPPFLVFPTSAFANPDPFSKLQERLSSFSTSGVPGGTYYVRIRGANGSAQSEPSNEAAVNVSGGCILPGAPTNFGAIIRGSFGMLQWNPGSGGRPSMYYLVADFTPGTELLGPHAVIFPLGASSFNVGIPTGTYYARVVAANACGISPASEELTLTSPSNTPARTPDPAPGERLPQPDVRALVAQFANEARALGYLNPQVACPPRAPGTYNPQYELEARKTQRNAYIDYVVRKLRTYDQRFGFNAKPTRAVVPAIIAGDEIAYHYGSDAPEGSPNVYLVDVLGGHCTGVSGDRDNHNPDYRLFYDEFGRWTLAGLTD